MVFIFVLAKLLGSLSAVAKSGFSLIFGTLCRTLHCGAVAAILLAPAQLLGQDTPTEAAHITAPKLFPETTLAYLRIDDVKDLKKRLDTSTLGKLSNDESIKPILSEFYGTLVQSTEQMQDAIGLNLDELLSIPSGELAIALLPPEKRTSRSSNTESDDGQPRRARIDRPVVVMLLDAGDEITSVEVLLQRIEKAMDAQQFEYTQKDVGRLRLHRYSNPTRRDQEFSYFIDDGVIVASSAAPYLETMAADWLAGSSSNDSLADNRKFISIMSRCVGTEGERPQISFYVDPLSIIREFTPKNAGTMLALGMIGPLGFDGIEAVGGSWIVSPPDFDAINHMHLLLSSPREAVLSLVRPKSGATTPEVWVPDSVGTYATINWDLDSTLKGIEQLFNKIRGEDALEKTVFAPVLDRFGIDIPNDVIANLDGRITLVQGFVRPVTINSGSNVYAFKLKNPEYFQRNVVVKIKELIETRTEVQTESFGKMRVNVIQVPRGRAAPDAPIRSPEICFTVYEDYLLIADSKYMMQQIASCIAGTDGKLIDSIEYQLVSERISAQLQEQECSAISFSRPEESLQLFYELARDPANRDRLRQVADNNGFFKALLAALEKQDLPPFSVISKYLAPSGGYLVEDETGMHYMSFSLRR